MAIISQCTCIQKHQVKYLKYIHFVNYTLIRFETSKNIDVKQNKEFKCIYIYIQLTYRICYMYILFYIYYITHTIAHCLDNVNKNIEEQLFRCYKTILPLPNMDAQRASRSWQSPS